MTANEEGESIVRGVVLASVVFAVLYRQLGRSQREPWRKYGPWAVVLALPMGVWLWVLVTPPPARPSLNDYAVVILFPLVMSLVPFGIARFALRYQSVIYYLLVIPLSLFGWLFFTCALSTTTS